MKIRTRLALTLGGTVASSFFVAAFVGTVAFRHVVLDILNIHHEQQTQLLASFAETVLSIHAEPLLMRYLGFLQLIPGVKSAYLVDRTGRIIMHIHPDFIGQSVGAWKASSFAAETIEHERSIQIGSEVVASVRIGFSQPFLQMLGKRVSEGTRPPFLVFGVVGMLLSLFVGLGLAAYIARPIQQLVSGAQEISRGNLTVELPVTSSDELGQLTRQFNDMVKQLKQVDELKAGFLAVVSHDVRSPLAAVQAYADHLLSGKLGALNPDQTQSVRTIRDECQRLGAMVSSFLDTAKIESGRMQMARYPFDLQLLLREAQQLFEAAATQQRVSLVIRMPEQLPHALGDPGRLRQVLTNLLANALKFTPSGGSVEVGARHLPDEGMIEVSIKDTGPGIPAEQLPHIFDQFGASMSATGSGLGLAISKGFVEALGGTMTVDSAVGRGTTVFVRVPEARPGGAGPFRFGA